MAKTFGFRSSDRCTECGSEWLSVPSFTNAGGKLTLDIHCITCGHVEVVERIYQERKEVSEDA
jgi:DNA-directed RNA polymerase subunit M/transcription elongation factor TFIIS